MEDWVKQALARWPNVPALFGWLQLDRRGRWRIRGELITRPQIIDTIANNYAADEQGRWYFQNGPQRGYVTLETAPLILRSRADGLSLETHTGRRVTAPSAAFLDEEGSLLLLTEHGPAALVADDLDWALQRLCTESGPADEAALEQALAQPCGNRTALRLHWGAGVLPLERIDVADAPARLGFVRNPQ